ncbi:hypothetical protein ACT4ML_08730 [Natrinema sp. LN54]|uniref:hypothetical protein n=1 Tax=Natrinema sp. LN54 TaxID=3458705 RepID=UPI0040353532
MSDRSDSSGDLLPDCPDCGRPVVGVTAVGPTEGYASPCGCQVPPGLIGKGCEP